MVRSNHAFQPTVLALRARPAAERGRWKYHRKFVLDENHDIDSEVRHDAAQKMGDWPPEVDLQE
jgi:hypothetical protein